MPACSLIIVCVCDVCTGGHVCHNMFLEAKEQPHQVTSLLPHSRFAGQAPLSIEPAQEMPSEQSDIRRSDYCSRVPKAELGCQVNSVGSLKVMS